MTPEEEIAKIEEELDGARRNLHETLSTVEAKMEQEVQRAETVFQPAQVLRDNIVGAACLAGLLGYAIGSSKYRKLVGPAIMFALGYKIWSELTTGETDEDGGESAGS